MLAGLDHHGFRHLAVTTIDPEDHADEGAGLVAGIDHQQAGVPVDADHPGVLQRAEVELRTGKGAQADAGLQVPEMRLGMILARSVMKYFRVPGSL